MTLKYDLHIHSCLSPCADDDMTPANIAAMAMLAGYDVVALSDHNSTRNCRAFLSAAEAQGLLALPAMELTTAEEVHVLCLFEDIAAAEEFGEYVYSRLPDIKNNAEFFGNQLIMDERDNTLGEEERLLISATDIGIYQLPELVRKYGGKAIPAHIDRDSFSVLANLAFFDRSMDFNIAEISPGTDVAQLVRDHPELAGLKYLKNSDAHSLFAMPDARRTIEVGERSVAAVFKELNEGEFMPEMKI